MQILAKSVESRSQVSTFSVSISVKCIFWWSCRLLWSENDPE